MRVQAARIGKPHGIRGEVTVQLLTDDPETRFARGEVLILDPASPLAPEGTLTVAGARWNKSILVLRFEEVSDRNGAETLRNHHLLIDTEEAEETEGYYEHELTGLAVYAVDPEERARAGEDPARARLGEPVGTVTGLQTLPTQDLLAVTLADGSESLVPFVAEIVPEVDLEAGRIVITPPPGLLELNREDADASRLAAEDGAQDGDAQAGGAPAGGEARLPAWRGPREVRRQAGRNVARDFAHGRKPQRRAGRQGQARGRVLKRPGSRRHVAHRHKEHARGVRPPGAERVPGVQAGTGAARQRPHQGGGGRQRHAPPGWCFRNCPVPGGSPHDRRKGEAPDGAACPARHVPTRGPGALRCAATEDVGPGPPAAGARPETGHRAAERGHSCVVPVGAVPPAQATRHRTNSACFSASSSRPSSSRPSDIRRVYRL